MPDLSDVVILIEEQGKGFEAFKSNYDKRMLALETKSGRPGNFGAGTGIDPSAPEFKAFDRFARTGDYERKSLQVGTGGDGGYTVPKEISQAIEALMLKQSVMRQLCNIERSSTLDYHKVVNRRGTAATWVGE